MVIISREIDFHIWNEKNICHQRRLRSLQKMTSFLILTFMRQKLKGKAKVALIRIKLKIVTNVWDTIIIINMVTATIAALGEWSPLFSSEAILVQMFSGYTYTLGLFWHNSALILSTILSKALAYRPLAVASLATAASVGEL